jgi:4-amino-4-deoxy-L-arabinose transferase-like glycosyltransferase
MTARTALWGLIAAGALLRLAFAASVGPSHDEAYYAQFATHRDWSYFDHPPMIAWVAIAGPALAGVAGSALALRLGFVALFAGSTYLMARLTARVYGPGAGVLAAFALNVAGYFGVVVGTFALPDGPLVFFWLLTLERLVAALEAPGRIGPWIGVGLAWGGALLSKYHAVFLPAGTLLFLLLEPSARHWLRKPGPYLALALGMLAFTPVVWWNATHGWASFAFQGSRALGPLGFRADALAGAIGGQAAYLFPWIWLGVAVVVVRKVRDGLRDASPADRFLLCQAVGPLTAFTAVACVRPVLPHWSLVGFLSLLPILGQDWARRLADQPARMHRRLILLAALPVALTGLVVAQARTGMLQKGGRGTLGLVAPAQDPTVDVSGWDQVVGALRRHGLIGRPGTFLFTCNWYYSGQLAFATRGAMPVLCYHPRDARGFAYWSRPEQWVGQDGILVALDDRSIEPGCYDRWFARIELIEEFPILRAGAPVHSVRLFRCVRQTRAFPFDDADQFTPRERIATARAPGDGRRR